MGVNALIKTHDLVKEYRISKEKTLRVLNNVNIEIRDGEIVSIVGPSGAGKSTLLHIIGTLDKPTSGEVIFEGEDISKLKSDNLAKFRNTKIGFIFQFHHLLPEFTALENVAITSMIAGKKQNEVYGAAKKLLEEVGLADRVNHKPAELSGGEAQRVAIARALVNSPRVILADEPTGNLDSKNSDEVIKLLFELKKKYNQTCVIVTHNENLASMTDRTLKMYDGKII
jgi:lipoprotein-releasing system ATP-binding protein